MTNKEFAEKYVGCIARSKDFNYKDSVGIVIGYELYSNYVVLDMPEYVKDGIKTKGIATSKKDPRLDIFKMLLEYEVYYTFVHPPAKLEIIKEHKIVDDADDCLECGAKGKDPCKNNCPNK